MNSEEPEKRKNVIGLMLVGALLLLAGAALPWWHLIDKPEPSYIKACRAISAVFAILTLVALWRPARRTGTLIAVGGIALVLPLLALLTIGLIDGAAITTAVLETNQASNLIAELAHSDVDPQVPWTEEVKMRGVNVIADDFTLVDAVETGSYFSKYGMYACLLGGACLLLAAWVWDAREGRRWLARRRWMLAAITAGLALVYFGRPIVAYYYWNRARAAELNNDYRLALDRYRRAMSWDRRLNYDILLHMELGRIYTRLGMTSEPDYWATIGDVYGASGDVVTAYQTYRRNIPNIDANPTIRMRYANTLFVNGVLDYDTDLYASALQKWEWAIRMDPTNIQVMYALARGYTKVGSYHTAILWWKNLIRANEGIGMFQTKFFSSMTYRKFITARAWRYLGWCYYKVNDYDSAEQSKFFATQIGKSSLDSVQ